MEFEAEASEQVLLGVGLLGALKWKEDLSRKAAEAFLRQQQAAPNLRKLIYGTGKELNMFLVLRLFPEKEMRLTKRLGLYF